MKKLTVSEYATEFKTSVQSVYQRIKRGSLESIKENGIKYVLIASNTGSEEIKSTLKSEVESEFKTFTSLIKRMQNQLDAKDKEIRRLTKKLDKCNGTKEKVLLQYIDELKQLRIAPVPTEDVVDVKVKKSKTKKKRKK